MLQHLLEETETLKERLLSAREKIIAVFESFEPTKRFNRTDWDYKHTGGGQIALLRGDIFEKAAVNISHIAGPSFPMDDAAGSFTACGVSLITHMHNPFVPTAHFNIRFIKTEKKSWIGGGYDLTPMPFIQQEDVNHFHNEAKSCLDLYDSSLYPLFKKQADEYFYIPHRNKTRGVGGLFFDHFSFGNLEKDFCFLEDLATSFLKALVPLIVKYQTHPYSTEDKIKQNALRAHYVEFNLLYDRGTRFGFLSQGNPEAILCSMPPTATW